MAYPDTITPWFGVIAIFLALRHRQQTGRGQYIDLSQYETTLHFLAPEVLDFFVNGRVVTRQGNRVSDSAPHGAYQCLGGDEWCTIAVSSDGEWHSFCCAIGNPQWTKDPKFVSLPTRKQNEDELDHLVNEWTIRFSSEEVMSKMQAHGVPAGVARTAKGIFEDPQLKHRNHFVVLQHPEVGYCSNPSWPAKLSKAPPQIRHAPCIGNDNTYVYSKLLGISNEEIGNLIADGVVEFL